MSDALAITGATLLAAATIPQAIRLIAHQRADGFGWPFVALNYAGLVLLAAHTAEIGEDALFGVNVVGAAFWALVALVKAKATWPSAGLTATG